MNTYKTNREWSDKYLAQVKRIVGSHLLVPTSFDVDTKEAADLCGLRASDRPVAVRVRRADGYEDRYPTEFTVRSQNKFGGLTEFDKFLRGFADWFFYGFAPV